VADFDLIEAIDLAAARLLEVAGFGVKVEGQEPVAVTLPEQVKAFEVVVKWAEARNDLKPPELRKSKFDGIREQFDGQKNKRRGRPATGESLTPTAIGLAIEPSGEPDPSAEPTVAPDLFDA
jgi:hypothetical protein